MDWKLLEEYKGRRGECDIHEPKRSRRYFFIWRSVTRRESAERSRRDIVYIQRTPDSSAVRRGGGNEAEKAEDGRDPRESPIFVGCKIGNSYRAAGGKLYDETLTDRRCKLEHLTSARKHPRALMSGSSNADLLRSPSRSCTAIY